MKNIKDENYLERKPMRVDTIVWNSDTEENVTLEITNKGVFNRIAQKVFKKPPITYIHLDEMGSFIWPLLDGDKSIVEIGEFVKEKFAEKAEPLYPRLAKHIQILESYKFIVWNND